MVQLKELIRYCDELLQPERFKDYSPNGLQIEGCAEVGKIVSGVTANKALIDAAVQAKADVLLVHHGFFWNGEPPQIVGFKHQRIAELIKNDISLVAYHLPLDAHEVYGNNAQLAQKLGLTVEGRFGQRANEELGMYGVLPKPMRADELGHHLAAVLGRSPLHLVGEGDMIEKVAWCSGAAQSYIYQAYGYGVQAFISGEVSENTTHFARESGVHYFAAGHHATERYGVIALGDYLAQAFDIEHIFIDIDNPV